MVDDEQAASPEEMLRLIEQQRADTLRRLRPDPLLTYVPWGVAWLVGFGSFFLNYGFDGTGPVPMGWQVALALLMGGQLIAMALMIYSLRKSTGAVRGDTAQRWAMWGSSWFAGFFVVGLIDLYLSKRLSDTEMSQVSITLAMLIVGLLYMTGGALSREWPMFLLGVWVSAVNGVGVLLAPGVQSLLLAVLAGGGAIAAGLWMRWRR